MTEHPIVATITNNFREIEARQDAEREALRRGLIRKENAHVA